MRVVVLCVYAVLARSFNYKSDYRICQIPFFTGMIHLLKIHYLQLIITLPFTSNLLQSKNR